MIQLVRKKSKSLIPDILKDKRGVSIIEFAISLLFFVMLVCFFVDLIRIVTLQYTVSQNLNETARKIGVQGGLMTTAPVGYPGGNVAYQSSSKIYAEIKERMEGMGLSEADWEVTLAEYQGTTMTQQKKLTPTTSFKVDYRNSIDIQIQYKYNWTIWSQMSGLKLETTLSQKRHSVSEFKYDYSNWGELK